MWPRGADRLAKVGQPRLDLVVPGKAIGGRSGQIPVLIVPTALHCYSYYNNASQLRTKVVMYLMFLQVGVAKQGVPSCTTPAGRSLAEIGQPRLDWVAQVWDLGVVYIRAVTGYWRHIN